MRKEWYIKFEDESEGPFSVLDLKRDLRVTPDSLARKEGMAEWLPIKEIPELKDVFKESKPPLNDQATEESEVGELSGQERILELSPDPNYLYYMLMALALIVLIFLYFQLFE